MSRIIVLCEGDTEELAVRYFIARQWQSDGLGSVALKPIDLRGKSQNVGKFATLYLDEPGVLAVFTLVDLQGNNQVLHQPNPTSTRKFIGCASDCAGRLSTLVRIAFSPMSASTKLKPGF